MAAPKLTTNRILVIVLAIAAALAAVLIAVSLTGGDDGGGTPSTTVHGAAATEKLLAGIPQKGNVLGDPDAPITIVEYADFQCPYCAQWATDTFPAIVDEYVRPGKAKVVFNGLAFLGPDSVPALQTAVSAGEQNKQWNVVELLFHNQGVENAGWVTDDLLRSIGQAVPGLDAGAMMDGREAPVVASNMAEAQQAAVAAGIDSTPTFQVGRTGGPLVVVRGARPIGEFRENLDTLLSQQ